MPRFLLQIAEGEAPFAVARFPAGGALERDFVAACTEAIVRRRVGFFRTEAQVKQAISDGITAAILDLKEDTRVLLG